MFRLLFILELFLGIPIDYDNPNRYRFIKDTRTNICNITYCVNSTNCDSMNWNLTSMELITLLCPEINIYGNTVTNDNRCNNISDLYIPYGGIYGNLTTCVCPFCSKGCNSNNIGDITSYSVDVATPRFYSRNCYTCECTESRVIDRIIERINDTCCWEDELIYYHWNCGTIGWPIAISNYDNYYCPQRMCTSNNDTRYYIGEGWFEWSNDNECKRYCKCVMNINGTIETPTIICETGYDNIIGNNEIYSAFFDDCYLFLGDCIDDTSRWIDTPGMLNLCGKSQACPVCDCSTVTINDGNNINVNYGLKWYTVFQSPNALSKTSGKYYCSECFCRTRITNKYNETTKDIERIIFDRVICSILTDYHDNSIQCPPTKTCKGCKTNINGDCIDGIPATKTHERCHNSYQSQYCGIRSTVNLFNNGDIIDDLIAYNNEEIYGCLGDWLCKLFGNGNNNECIIGDISFIANRIDCNNNIYSNEIKYQDIFRCCSDGNNCNDNELTLYGPDCVTNTEYGSLISRINSCVYGNIADYNLAWMTSLWCHDIDPFNVFNKCDIVQGWILGYYSCTCKGLSEIYQNDNTKLDLLNAWLEHINFKYIWPLHDNYDCQLSWNCDLNTGKTTLNQVLYILTFRLNTNNITSQNISDFTNIPTNNIETINCDSNNDCTFRLKFEYQNQLTNVGNIIKSSNFNNNIGSPYDINSNIVSQTNTSNPDLTTNNESIASNIIIIPHVYISLYILYYFII